MPSNFVAIDSPDKFEALLIESVHRPVLLFKHSNSCGISADVLEQLGTINSDVHVLVVQDHRDLSNSVVARLGIRHASPQAFVLRNGSAIYHATHYGIDPDEIANKLRQ